MPRKRILEAPRPSDRAKQRQKLGTLRDLTVQPATKRRYSLAVDAFFSFLREEGQALPHDKSLLDPLVCDFLEHLWSSGAGRAQACDTLAGLQDLQPSVKGHLPGAWRLLKTWNVNEIPNRAPPLPEHIVQALAGWAFFKGWVAFGVSLLVGFYSMLRTGELLDIRSSAVLIHNKQSQVLISLGLTKGGKRQGAAESVILGVDSAVNLVKKWKSLVSGSNSLCPSPAKWRSLFNDGLKALGCQEWGFRPYSLRRGGATFWFSKHQSLDKILVQGRWHTQKSARIYINEGVAMLASMQIPKNSSQIRPYLQVFNSFRTNLNFRTLEPPTSVGRSGGSGRKLTKSRKRQKSAFIFSC